MRHDYKIKGKYVTRDAWNAHSLAQAIIDEAKDQGVELVANITVVLPNGAKVEGPYTAVLETAKLHGLNEKDIFPEKDWYISSSKGPIRIETMESHHLMNVANKLMGPFLKGLVKNSKVGADWVTGLRDWRGLDNHPQLLSIIHCLNKRYNK